MSMHRRKRVEEITGIPARRIQFYTEQGLLPMVEAATGRGREREYSDDDVFRLAFIKEMAELGIALSKMKVFLNSDEGMADLAVKMQSVLLNLSAFRTRTATK